VEITWENIGDPIQKGEQLPVWMKEIVQEHAFADKSYGYVDTIGVEETREFLANLANQRGGCQISREVHSNRSQAARLSFPVMLTVRDATLGDLETIVSFNCRLAEESEDCTLDRDVLRRGVTRALADVNRCRYFVAESGGEVVGQAMVTYEWSDWRDGVLWWFQSVYVRREHRRRGVGALAPTPPPRPTPPSPWSCPASRRRASRRAGGTPHPRALA
jgi:GNAT superfamily N-acetyltransferase